MDTLFESILYTISYDLVDNVDFRVNWIEQYDITTIIFITTFAYTLRFVEGPYEPAMKFPYKKVGTKCHTVHLVSLEGVWLGRRSFEANFWSWGKTLF